jgi:hypothetical protein
MFLGLPDPLVWGTDPDPSIIKQKLVRKTLITTVLQLRYDFLSLKNDANVASKSNKQKISFSCLLEGHWWKQKDLNQLYLNVTYPQHCLTVETVFVFWFISWFFMLGAAVHKLMMKVVWTSVNLGGFHPSTLDVQVAGHLATPTPDLPNLLRWYNHLRSFSQKGKHVSLSINKKTGRGINRSVAIRDVYPGSDFFTSRIRSI